MDVHAPHQPVHTWRDFLTHLAIVTIGLFIALMLEALVEHFHHRELVREARTNLHLEIAANCDAARQDIGYAQANVAVLAANIVTLHKLADKPNGQHYRISNAMQWNDFSSAAWRTAHESGALSFMPYDEVQRFSDLYANQDFIESRAEQLFDRNILALAPFKMGIDPAKFSPDDLHGLLRANADVEVQFDALAQVVQQYHDRCQAALSRP